MIAEEVMCVGELLWDSLPAGLFLGGAPYNVAGHLHALGVGVGVISRVGSDRLGEEAIERVVRHGISADLIQVDDAQPTGFVSIALDDAGTPTYDIVAPAAWDGIEIDDGVLARAGRARAIVFGSLAQRAPRSRETIRRLCELEPLKVFDVNLRPPFVDPDIIKASLQRADVVKLNEHELRQLSTFFDLPTGLRAAVTALARTFACTTVCVTRGTDGAVLLHDGRWSENAGYRIEVRDTVGSGDAFLAALLRGLLMGERDEILLQRANLLGAFVATRSGAIPAHDELEMSHILMANAHGRPLPTP